MINFNHTLYLASQSASRKELLDAAQIPFVVLPQSADEKACDWNQPLGELVCVIARHKMDNLVLPKKASNQQEIFVLTADTLSQDRDGTLQGKPVDRADARTKIIAARAGSQLATAFCLDRYAWQNNDWQRIMRIERCVYASYFFDVPDQWIDIYLERSMGLVASNAIAVEGYGAQFLRMVEGSYSTIVGLPMFELRQALEEIGFFE